MKKIIVADATLRNACGAYNFKEKLEIARQLDKLGVDVIELPEISDEKADFLLISTLVSTVKNAVISVGAKDENGITKAAAALSGGKKTAIRIELPVSAVGLEYTCHLKPAKFNDYLCSAVDKAVKLGFKAEFCALDATRAEKGFLLESLKAAESAGAYAVSVYDDSADMFPDDFAAFVCEAATAVSVPVGVYCSDKNSLAVAKAVLAVKVGASAVKTAHGAISLETFSDIIKNSGEKYGLSCGVKYTELHRTVKQITWVSENAKDDKKIVTVSEADDALRLDEKDSKKSVKAAVKSLGYDFAEDDYDKIYEEFLRVAAKKNVGAKELDAIVASVALQVPATYKLVSYIINNGNIISASAQIKLMKDGQEKQGVCIGDGPIDAAFLAIEQIIGHHYELDDFQIQAVTEGKEAMGSALVKLRSNGKLYSGNGISTDIIGASIRAYVNALNKIVYEEN